jgi:hypothetical protein
MTINETRFKAFSNFSIDDIPVHAEISRRMLQRLEDIENTTTSGPLTPAGRAALASSVIAHAVVELEAQLLELTRHLDRKKSKDTRQPRR